MKILFTRSKYPLSKLICHLTEEPVSHCSIYDEENDWVYHSSFKGVERLSFEEFMTSQVYIISLSVADIPDLEEHFDKHKNSWYDVFGLLFLGLRYLIPGLPKVNLWQITGMYLCTEWVTHLLYGIEDSLITPYKLFKELEEHKMDKEKRK